MYDVVEKKIGNGKTQLWCWLDSKETILNQKLQKIFSSVFSHDSKTKDKENLVFSFYKTLYFQEIFEWKPFVSDTSKIALGHKKTNFNLQYISIILPPPQRNFLLYF